MNMDTVLIWDNDRTAYVRPSFIGFTPYRGLAGRFTTLEAESFCGQNANAVAVPIIKKDTEDHGRQT
jgi:hypothetical protein